MMRERLIALRERRAALILHAQSGRSELAGWLARSDKVSRWIDAGLSVADELRRRPLLIAAALALLFALRPKRVLGWATSAWSLWQLARRAGAWWRLLAPPPGAR